MFLLEPSRADVSARNGNSEPVPSFPKNSGSLPVSRQGKEGIKCLPWQGKQDQMLGPVQYRPPPSTAVPSWFSTGGTWGRPRVKHRWMISRLSRLTEASSHPSSPAPHPRSWGMFAYLNSENWEEALLAIRETMASCEEGFVLSCCCFVVWSGCCDWLWKGSQGGVLVRTPELNTVGRIDQTHLSLTPWGEYNRKTRHTFVNNGVPALWIVNFVHTNCASVQDK